MNLLLAEGFVLGLSTGLYCLGACAPLFVPLLVSEGGTLKTGLAAVLEFLLGRLIAYLLFAAGVSLLSRRFAVVPEPLLGWALLLSGLVMLLYGLVQNLPMIPLCAGTSRLLRAAKLPFWLGFLIGINVCPPFVAGLARLVALRNVWTGMTYFAAFFAGTTLYISPLIALPALGRSQRLRAIASISAVLSGLWFSGLGLARLW
jgi:sulfite exporter TauE/SafE